MWRSALQPLASLYGVGVWLRNRLFDEAILPMYRSALPVICVGNISLGGNGKTPFCMFLLELLHSQGRHPVLLTRGYGGRTPGPLLLEASHVAADVGDETLLYRQRFAKLPIVIARDRVAGAKFIESQLLGDCIVMDDGFQHRYLQRDVNLVLFDSGTSGLAAGEISDHLLPRGRLREPAFAALQRADAVVFVCKQPNNSEISVPYGLELPSWKFNLLPTSLVDVYSGAVVEPNILPDSLTAVAAIARPESFVQSLAQLGHVPSQKRFYRDHHRYSLGQWQDILATSSLPIVTTSKDAVKLKPFLTSAGQLTALQLGGELPADQRHSFATFVSSKISAVTQSDCPRDC